jgi:hypothetical protein
VLALAAAAAKTDLTEELRSLPMPAIVFHASAMRIVPIDLARYVATCIPDCMFVEIGENEWVDALEAIDLALLEFLGGQDSVPPELPHGTAVILFVDIVDSTALTERLGDAAFRCAPRSGNRMARRSTASC